MVHKQDLREELKLSCSKGKLSKTQANRKYIEALTGKLEHIYRGELPYPKQSSRLGKDVLATNGQVMYLYTVDWNRR
jgi:hypothetical protein